MESGCAALFVFIYLNEQHHCHHHYQGVQVFHSRSVIMTAPGYVAAKLVGGEDGVLPEAKALGDVYYPPVASVTIAYPNRRVTLHLYICRQEVNYI